MRCQICLQFYICTFHTVQISVEIYSKNYIFLSSYFHLKFQFKYRKVLEPKNQHFESFKQYFIFKSIYLILFYYVDVRKNCRHKEYRCQRLT